MTGVATAERTLHTTEVHQPPESNQGHQEAAEHVQPVAEPFAIVTLVDHAHHDGGEQREHPSYTVPSEPRISQVVQSPSAKRHGVQTCALPIRSEEHTSELQSPCNLVCRLLLEKKKTRTRRHAPRQPCT